MLGLPPMAYAIHVTAEDIDRGKPGLCTRCPVALALNRCLPIEIQARGPIWVSQNIWVDGDGYELTQPVADFINAFDHGEPVEPFTFTLDLCPPAPAVT